MSGISLVGHRAIRFLVGLAAGFLLSLVPIGQLQSQEAQSPANLQARIDLLIQQLDDDKFEAREKAEADLVAIGEPAIGKLAAATKDAAAERSQRAAKVLK